VAISYRQLPHAYAWNLVIWPWHRHASQETLHVTATVVLRHGESQKHMLHDPYTLLCDVTAHAFYSNGPCTDTKETLPQYCCVAHELDRAHRAAAQQCLEQIRHNI
jgi:hypothetical protein